MTVTQISPQGWQGNNMCARYMKDSDLQYNKKKLKIVG